MAEKEESRYLVLERKFVKETLTKEEIDILDALIIKVRKAEGGKRKYAVEEITE